jgi:catechol 2,3-dioxygenase-like lactoylglutathione lyase family enzyme
MLRSRNEEASVLDHLGIVSSDLQRAGEFYRAVLTPLGIKATEDHSQADGTGWIVFSSGTVESSFFVVAAGRPSFWPRDAEPGKSPAHFAFRAPSRDAVEAFHAAGLAAGAKSNGEPGVRRGRYYCAFLIDPDGNNIEAGVHADA